MGRPDLLPLLFALLVFFQGCGGTLRQPVLVPPGDDPAQTPASPVTGYEDGTEGETAPRWLRLYQEGGCRAVEQLPEFTGLYVFVAANEGGNAEILNLWASEFSAARDTPRLVASRVEERMTGRTLYPDDEYGEFFERFAKAVSDSPFGEASAGQVYRTQRRITEEDGAVRERHYFFIPVTIPKPLLQEKLSDIMKRITTRVKPAREQAAAVNRLKADFFDGF
ncbi:MAG: hypothetical protein LBL44_02060 [Treponema sp.]|nr:hypothetical protein [Treponema sp.]